MIIVFLAQTGMRQETLVQLRCRHLIWDEGVDSLRIHVPAAISKLRVEYDTFLLSEGVRLLKMYLGYRRQGTRKMPPEEIGPESPVIRSKRSMRGVNTNVTWSEVHRAMRMTGLVDRSNKGKPGELRPHSLRKYFKTALESAGLSRAYVEYMMGHRLPGTDSSYFRPTITQLRQAYKKAEPYLMILKRSREEIRGEVRDLLREAARATRDPEVNRVVDELLEAMARRK